MLSDLGKFLRKLRIDRGDLLKEMADKLEMTPAYLSAIETNKRVPPSDFASKIRTLYNLDKEQSGILENYFISSRNANKVDLKVYNNTDRELMLSFARKINNLDNSDKETIKNILSNLKEL